MSKQTIDLTGLPVFLDGSDGSLWQARNTWEQLYRDRETARKRFIKVSDVLALLENDFNLVIGDVTAASDGIVEGPSRDPLHIDEQPKCDCELYQTCAVCRGETAPGETAEELSEVNAMVVLMGCKNCGHQEKRDLRHPRDCTHCGSSLMVEIP